MAGNIMIVGERGSSTDGWMWAACYGIYFNAIGEWDANGSDASDEYEPTHWQALPLPPTE
jgi:hypothetical protein